MARAKGDIAPAHHDRALWFEAVREVTPLPGRRAGSSPLQQCAPARAEAVPAPSQVVQPLERLAGVDRASAERLKRGLRAIEARLDLHGMTQAEAHRELIDFVVASYQAGRRCVLVITGRGLGPDGPGVLKNAVPRWLEEAGLRRMILAVAAAQPRHGGAGALYLLLRRQR
jgi:DNA-nicking Smr family endonuclease